MKGFLRWFALATGLLTVAGQLARFGGGVLADVRPWDDIASGLALAAAAALAARPSWHAAAWALFTGVHLTTLVVNAHETIGGSKTSGPFYVAVLALICLVGAAATTIAARRA